MATTLTTDTQPIALPFTNIEMTQAVNNLPSVFGMIGAEGYFPAEGMATAFVRIDIVDGVLTALPVTSPDAPSTTGKKDTERAIFLPVPNISHEITLWAQDIRNLLMAGASGDPRTMVSEMNKYLARLKMKFDFTLELMRMSALKGIIIDGANSEIYNLFTVFEITQPTVTWTLSDASFDIQAACAAVLGDIEDNLSDETMTGITVRVARDFFNALIKHPNVSKYWLQTEEAQALANVKSDRDNSYQPRALTFGNIRFKEYTAKVPMFDGTSQRIIESLTGYAFPTGTMDTHYTYVAPPVDIRALTGAVASTDEVVHVTQEMLRHGTGIELKGQMNALPLWRRPKLLKKITLA